MGYKRSHHFLVYVFSPRLLRAYWLSAPSMGLPLQLHGQYRASLDQLQLEQLYICNPTRLSQLVQRWYAATQRTMPILFALEGPALVQQILALPTAHPTPALFPTTAVHLHTAYTYLYSLDNKHYFYYCSLPQPLLFQYHLLALRANLPLITITPSGSALLGAYRGIFGTAYRAAHLATALAARNNTLDQLFSRDDIARLVTVPSLLTVLPTDMLSLLIACGICIDESNNEAYSVY
jgi:hypothetical protein